MQTSNVTTRYSRPIAKMRHLVRAPRNVHAHLQPGRSAGRPRASKRRRANWRTANPARRGMRACIPPARVRDRDVWATTPMDATGDRSGGSGRQGRVWISAVCRGPGLIVYQTGREGTPLSLARPLEAPTPVTEMCCGRADGGLHQASFLLFPALHPLQPVCRPCCLARAAE